MSRTRSGRHEPVSLCPSPRDSHSKSPASRVCEVYLHGDNTFNLRQKKYKVSDALKTGEVTTLFGERLFHLRYVS